MCKHIFQSPISIITLVFIMSILVLYLQTTHTENVLKSYVRFVDLNEAQNYEAFMDDALEKRLNEEINKTYERADAAFVMARMSLWYNGEEFGNNIGVQSWQSLPEFPTCLFENMNDIERLRSIDTFEPTIMTYAVDRGNITYFTSVTKENLRCAYLSEQTNYLTLPMDCEDICTKS